MKESRYFIPKIIAGYLLLAAMCAAMIAYIYHKVDSSTAVDPVLSAIESRNAMIDRTLVGLYRAESRAQMILAGDDSYIALYDEDVEASLACIDSLKNTVILSDDPVRAARLDTVSMLVKGKRRELLRLAQGLRDGSDASRIIERNIARLGERDAAAQDSLAASQSDTALVNMRRRKFFRRVAELFEIETDTTEHVAPAPVRLSDTIGGLLVDLQSQVERQREDSERRMTRIRREVTSANNQLDRRILDLIDEVRHDWDAHHARRRAERDAARRDAVSALGMVALSAIVLVFVFLAVILRDWRRSRRVRAELERANDEKQRLLDYREHLMLAVTHDLKAPAGSIMGYADLLERLDNDHRQRLYITGMKQSAEHLQTLIESLLEFYRLDDGRAEKESKPFNAARMMRDAARDAAASRHRRPEVEIGTHIDASADATVISDAMRIRRIVDNLLSNALKFTSRGTVTLACGIRGGELCISVTDTGCGMSAEECSRIFDSFVRLESAAGVEGFGLGLSIVERSVRLLAGSIDVESGKGRGSTFRITIPLDTPTATQPDIRLDGIRLLAIDDDRLQLDLIRSICRTLGVAAECILHGSHAARIVSGGGFDVVMTDLQMPGCDGLEVLRSVKLASPSLPVIAATARNDSPENALRAAGFAAVVRKPYTVTDIKRVLKQTLGNAGTDCRDTGPTAPAQRDFSAITAFAEDDAEAQQDLLAAFVGGLHDAAAAMRTAADADDAETIRRTAHRIRPNVELVGDSTLSLRLHAIEDPASGEDVIAAAGPAADAMDRLADKARIYAAALRGEETVSRTR